MKNCKMLVIILSVLLVSACSKVLTQHHLKDADTVCKDKGGIYELRVLGTNETFVYCKDGSKDQI
jgi:hypothetical protein